jgi:hypothetical protein
MSFVERTEGRKVRLQLAAVADPIAVSREVDDCWSGLDGGISHVEIVDVKSAKC